MEFDMTGVSPEGFITLPKGEYPIRTGEWWLRKKEETGSLIIDIDLEVTGGEYKGETPRYWHTMDMNSPKTKGFLLRLTHALGITSESDRVGERGSMKVAFDYLGGKSKKTTDEKGRVRIFGVLVNDKEERSVEGCNAIAFIEKDDGFISGFKPAEGSGTDPLPASTKEAPPSSGSGKKNDIPF